MAEIITVGLIGASDISFGYGTFSTAILSGSTISMPHVNLSYLYTPYTVTYSATPVFNLQNGITQSITLTGNVTSSTITNGASTIPTGSRIVLRITQDGTGSRTFAYPATVNGSAAFPISATASATTRIELQYNGTAWEFAAIPIVVSSGVLTGNIPTGSGTATYIPKFTAANTIAISDMTDNGAGLLTYKYNSAGDTKAWVANETNGAASRAVLYVGGHPTTPDNIDIQLVSQKSGNTTNSWDLAGVVRTGSGSTKGLILSSSAGPIKFQPAGTTTHGAFFLSTTASSVLYNLELGTTTATGTDSTPLYVVRSFNGSSDLTIINASSTGSGRTAVRMIAGGGSLPDVYLAVTSAGYTLAGGIPASTAFLYTGGGTTGGLIVQTTAGNLLFQIAGTTTIGTMTVREMQMTGRFRGLGLNRVSPTSGSSIDMFYDTTGGGNSGVIATATWGASETLSLMQNMNMAGLTHAFYTGANYAVITAKVTINSGIQVGAPTGGDKGVGTINTAADIYKNNTAFTNPKWALQHYFTGTVDAAGPFAPMFEYKGLRPLDGHRDFVSHHHDLPLMLKEPGAGLFGRGDLLLASLEEAYLYIYQLHDRINVLEKGASA